MGKITDFGFGFGDKETAVYGPGETVYGHFRIVVSGEIKVNAVTVNLYGRAYASWTPLLKRDEIEAEETYLARVCTVFGGKGTPVLLTEGTHTYRWRFQLPDDGLPSSFEGSKGAARYWLKFRVDKKFPGIDFVKLSPITVLANLPISTLQAPLGKSKTASISKVLGIGNAGQIFMKATIDRSGYCPGDRVVVKGEVRNESTKDCGVIRAKLDQKIVWKIGSDTDTENKTIYSVELAKGCAGNNSITWNKYFQIPFIPPSTVPRTIQLVTVSYSLAIESSIGVFGESLQFPVTIGTVPANVDMVMKTLKNNVKRLHFSAPLAYKKCTIGTQTCHKSNSNFSYVSYIPYTVDSSQVHQPTSNPNQQPTAPQQATPGATNTTTPLSQKTSIPATIKSSPSAPSQQDISCINPTTPHQHQPHKSTHIHDISDLSIASAPLPDGPPPSYDSIHPVPVLPAYSITNPPTPISSHPNGKVNIAAQTLLMSMQSSNTTTCEQISTAISNPQSQSQIQALVTSTITQDTECKHAVVGLLYEQFHMTKMADVIASDTISRLSQYNGYFISNIDDFELKLATSNDSKHFAATFLSFQSADSAMRWVDYFLKNINLITGIRVLMAENSMKENKEWPINPTLFPHISVIISSKNTDSTTGMSKKDLLEYVKLTKTTVTPLRAQCGGKLLIFCQHAVKLIAGDWYDVIGGPASDAKLAFSLSQWPSKEHHKAFLQAMKSHPDYERLMLIYKSRNNIIASISSIYS